MMGSAWVGWNLMIHRLPSGEFPEVSEYPILGLLSDVFLQLRPGLEAMGASDKELGVRQGEFVGLVIAA